MRTIINTKFLIPQGVRDFLPNEVYIKNHIEDVARQGFNRWGYAEIITPTFEYYDVLSTGDNSNTSSLMYRFFDRNGKILGLRPDMTTPIARVAATKLADMPRPLRLCYIQSIFRYEDTQAGRQREFYQAGAEFIGEKGPDADGEIISMAANVLSLMGLSNFKIDIGHVGYVDGLLETMDINENERINLKELLYKKDFVGLKTFIDNINTCSDDKKVLMELRRLRGPFDKIVERARKLTKNKKSISALDNLCQIYSILKLYGVHEHISIDLGMVKDLTYYTGMVMEGYSRDIGYTLCTGGRYDNLIGKFGKNDAATGFALGIERVLLTLERQSTIEISSKLDYLICVIPEKRSEALKLAEILRKRKKSVQVDVVNKDKVKRNLDESLENYAKEKAMITIILGEKTYKIHLDNYKKENAFKSIDELGDYIWNI